MYQRLTLANVGQSEHAGLMKNTYSKERGKCVLGFVLTQPISINKVILNPTERGIIFQRTALCSAR